MVSKIFRKLSGIWKDSSKKQNQRTLIKLTQPSVELVVVNPVTVTAINYAARTCYKSLMPKDDEKQKQFVLNLIKNKHETPLEFADITFTVVCSRDIANEIVRHRLASYQQESQRYVKYEEELPIIIPEDLDPYGKEQLFYFIRDIAKVYCDLRKKNKPEIARAVLPNCTATKLVVKMNLRELRHFIKLRSDKAAHPEMRRIIKLLYNILPDNYKELVKDCYAPNITESNRTKD